MNVLVGEVELKTDLMLKAYRLSYNKTILDRNIAVQYIISNFGIVIYVISFDERTAIFDIVENNFKDHRVFYIFTQDLFEDKRQELLWVLMRSGYIRWLRTSFPNQYPKLLEAQNLSNKIIEQRLKIYNERQKYKYLIEENELAKKYPIQQILSVDIGFFDYMPEKED